MNRTDAPRLAVVLPIFRHSSLVIETIEAVLAQEAEFGIRTLLVNDGCPFPETDAVCRDYALAYPDRVTYLRKPNGGLSDARNYGIRHVLEDYPSVEAVYLMDADNMLRPGAMKRAMAELDAHPEADWIYPDIDMFGLNWRSEYGGAYSVLVHTEMNTCEAGSLIRKRVFEAGCLFDTEFKLGWEDWDFFLSAAQAGFRGRNLEHFGFLYRKRPESMLANSERDQAALTGAMRLKHKPIMLPRAQLQMEQDEVPRYAIHLGKDEIIFCVDPLAPGSETIAYDRYERDYWRSRTAPGRYRMPPFNIVMPPQVFEALRAAGLLHWVLWAFEAGLRQQPVVVLSVRSILGDRMSLEELDTRVTGGAHADAIAMAVSPHLFNEVIDDTATTWIDTLANARCEPSVKVIRLGLPSGMEALEGLTQATALYDFLSLVHRLR